MVKKCKKVVCTYHNPYTRRLYRALCRLSKGYYGSSTITVSQISSLAIMMDFTFGEWFVKNLYILQREQYISILYKDDVKEFWIDIIPF